MPINKIIAFNKPAGQNGPTQARPGPGENSFARELEAALVPAKGQNALESGACRIISLENQRALGNLPGRELREAGQLLSQLTASIAASSKNVLENLHSLEGLVQFHRV